MSIARRIFVSTAADQWLQPNQNDLKWAIVEKIEKLGYIPEIFTNPKGAVGLAGGKAWSAPEADRVMRRCIGAAIIGLPRWSLPTPQGVFNFATEYNHFEGAIAFMLGLPLLVVAQEDLERRVVFDMTFGNRIGHFPPTANRSWLKSPDFLVPFENWKNQLSDRRDVFLGYCSSSTGTAQNLKRFLEGEGVSVLDWKDFSPGRSILEQIQEAAARCSGGIFLFTQDDKLADKKQVNQAVPRDNVVFEAGYFINAKGKDRVLIVLENGAKMPADLGGDIYAGLSDKSDIGPIEDTIRKFIVRF